MFAIPVALVLGGLTLGGLVQLLRGHLVGIPLAVPGVLFGTYLASYLRRPLPDGEPFHLRGWNGRGPG